MPWWFAPALATGRALFDIIGAAFGADREKLDKLGERVPIVLEEGARALEIARAAAQTEDELTAKAFEDALARVRRAGKGEPVDPDATKP